MGQTIVEQNEVATEGAGLCWSCDAAVPMSAHFCSACGKVQPAGPMDHFSFFGLPRKLNIDAGTLEKEFYRLSRKLHPDVYARGTAREQEWSLGKSAQLNDAYRALKDPISRTQYLLELEGVQMEEQSSVATAQARENGIEKKQVVPPELLEEVFELNMQLQELKMAKQVGEDAAETQAALDSARAGFEQRLDALTAGLKGLWDQWDAVIDKNSGSADDSAPANPVLDGSGRADVRDKRVAVRDKMVALLNQRNYIRNLVRDVTAALEE